MQAQDRGLPLRDFAERTLPALRSHREKAKEVRKGFGGGGVHGMAKRRTRLCSRAAEDSERTSGSGRRTAEEAPRRASRPIWNGTIRFGLVNVPVELRPGEVQHELELQLLDERDHAPVGYVRRNRKAGEELTGDEIVRGLEIAKGRFVVLDDDDLKRAKPKATRTIEILEFVDAAPIPPLYFERPYYLVPAAAGLKGYALLRETLRRTRKAGIAKVVLHTRERLAALVVVGDVLVLDLLRFANEPRSAEDLRGPPSGRGRGGRTRGGGAGRGGSRRPELVDRMALLQRSVARREAEGRPRCSSPRKVAPRGASSRRGKRTG